MVRTRLDVYRRRSRRGITYGRDLRNSQHMGPSWQQGAVAVTLCDARHRPTVDLKSETEIPPEVRRSIHYETAWRVMISPKVTGTRLRNTADKNCARKN